MKFRNIGITSIILAACAYGFLSFLQRERTIEGVWLWQFEGSDFFEGQLPLNPCELYYRIPGWLEYSPTEVYPNGSIYRDRFPSSGTYRTPEGMWRIEAFAVKFKGRQKFSLWGTGHFGMWWSSFNVDSMISVKPIAGVHCYVRGD